MREALTDCYSVETLNIIAIALAEEQVTVSYFFSLIFIFDAVLEDLTEVMSFIFIPYVVIDRLRMGGAVKLRSTVKWIAIVIFVILTCLYVADVGLVSASYAKTIQANVYGNPNNLALIFAKYKVDFAGGLLLLLYAVFLLGISVISGRTGSKLSVTNSIQFLQDKF